MTASSRVSTPHYSVQGPKIPRLRSVVRASTLSAERMEELTVKSASVS